MATILTDARPRWRDWIAPKATTPSHRVVGVFEGEGIGPEIIRATLEVLTALDAVLPLSVEIRRGGVIGKIAEKKCGTCLPAEAIAFCEEVFGVGGAILAGPGGGRFVYEMRRHFDLFCKLSPIRPCPWVAHAGGLRPQHLDGVDILFVRENSQGVYQGEGAVHENQQERWAEHRFVYREPAVARLLTVAARIARQRRGVLQVVVKEGGVPAITELWSEMAHRVAQQHAVRLELVNMDHAAYRVVRHPRDLDVVATPNLFGDILADVAGVLVGSRGLTYGASFAATGAAVYQTNHGSAAGLAGTNRANPVGQMYALAMLLHESFGLTQAANRIESAIESVWRAGWRTEDLAEPGQVVCGTAEFAALVVQAIRTGEVAAPRP
ncbi:MAG: isocitrate/isopropylmalate family dehydrogenase [Verrucomicrobiae bacterium]|nr:isocitrate/isopropylmalate family dehydrogenase [Verrucomicrobiae bacterium]